MKLQVKGYLLMNKGNVNFAGIFAGIVLSLVIILFITFHYTTCQVQAGELHYWKDKEGNVHISDGPPAASAGGERIKKIEAPKEEAAAPKEDMRQAPQQKLPPVKETPSYSQKEVTIYTNAT
jgi:hypothetical protein